MTLVRRIAVGAVLAVVVGCNADKITGIGFACSPTSTGTTVQPIPVFGARVLRAVDFGRCLTLSGASGTYLVVPNFASEGASTGKTPFVLGAMGNSAVPVPSLAPPPGRSANFLQSEFDLRLRASERLLAADAPAAAARIRAERLRRATTQASSTDTLQSFKVLGDLNGTTFKTATARLKYTGANIAVYVDTNAPPGFSDAELQKFGDFFDQTLYTIDATTFGAPSDLDGNGHVIVLLTPLINALTSAADCATTGFVTGYFYGFDLSNGGANSNKGEVFYALVPDPAGTVSCAHDTTSVARLVPATFIHEFQHMISYNQHVLLRSGPEEETWLNEGMSHMAEELGSRYFEDRYPSPAGRSDPAQLFPDSSQGFILGDLLNAYDYLDASTASSVTTFANFGTLQERGAVWLFLRWLTDQKGDSILTKLEQTSLTGIANVTQQAGEPFRGLFGDFSLALYTDSLPGWPRDSVPARYRFATRNLRQVFARLYATSAVAKPFPITANPLGVDAVLTSSMPAGTMEFHVVQAGTNPAGVALGFAKSDRSALPSTLEAQLSILHLPSP